MKNLLVLAFLFCASALFAAQPPIYAYRTNLVWTNSAGAVISNSVPTSNMVFRTTTPNDGSYAFTFDNGGLATPLSKIFLSRGIVFGDNAKTYWGENSGQKPAT